MSNLFADIPAQLPQELVDVLVDEPAVRIERIVSRGHSSAADAWYDQQQHEFVLLLSGGARLQFESPARSVELVAGDHLLIPAHQRHRVAWTADGQDSVWLAVFFGGDQPSV